MSPHYWAGAGRGTKSPQQHAVGKVSRSRTHQFEGRQHRIEIVRAAERNLSIARFNGNDPFAGRDKVGYMPAKLATHISHALRPPRTIPHNLLSTNRINWNQPRQLENNWIWKIQVLIHLARNARFEFAPPMRLNPLVVTWESVATDR
jgi:hypothetical protein